MVIAFRHTGLEKHCKPKVHKQCKPRSESDQDLHCLLFHLHLLAAFFYGRIFQFEFKNVQFTAKLYGIRIFRYFTVADMIF